MQIKKFSFHICLVSSIIVSASAYAGVNQPSQSLSLGIGVINAPKYMGSHSYSTDVIPVVDAHYNGLFFNNEKGLGYHLDLDHGFYLENTLNLSLGRSDKNSNWRAGSDRLKGMGKIKTALYSGVALGWEANDWLSFEGQANLPLTDSQGVNYQTSIKITPLVSDSSQIDIVGSALFGDARYMNTQFGVSQRQHENSGYQRYNAKDGLYGYQIGADWSYQLTQHWGGAVGMYFTELTNKASNSPIVDKKSGLTSAVSISYLF